MFELHADAYALLFCASIFYPFQAACGGLLYAIGTLVYGVAYPFHPSRRLIGEAIYIPGVLWLVYLVGKTAWTLKGL